MDIGLLIGDQNVGAQGGAGGGFPGDGVFTVESRAALGTDVLVADQQSDIHGILRSELYSRKWLRQRRSPL